jgi:gas vesicle protein
MDNIIDNEKNINIVQTQTNYDYNTAKEKLLQFDNNIEKVINDYLGIGNLKVSKIKTSTNQKIYSQIRNLMDESAKNFEKK